jgi:PAS domain S-box-containing protein
MLEQGSTYSTTADGLQSLTQFETLISDLSGRFINLLPDQVDGEIERAMGQLREFLEIDRWGLLEVFSNGGAIRLSHGSYGRGIPEVPKTTNLALLFPWCSRMLVEEGQSCIYSTLMDMPDEADCDKQNFRAMGIRSPFLIPLYVTGKVKYVLAANSVHGACYWPDECIARLRLLGEIFANALVRKQADQALRESTARLDSAIDVADLGFYELRGDPGQVFFDDRLGLILGIPWEDSRRVREYWLEHIHPDDLGRVLDLSRKMLGRELDWGSIEYRYRHPGQGLRWLSHSSRHVGGDLQEAKLHLVGVIRDITERKLAEEALHESEEVNRVTFEQAAVSIAHVGTDGRFLRVNDQFCALVGYEREELMKLTFQDITHPEDLEMDLSFVRQVLAGEIKTHSMDKRYLRKDRSPIWMNRTVSLARDRAGEPRYFISVVQDITQRRQMEAELRSHLREIEELKQQLEQENLYLREAAKDVIRLENLDGSSEALKTVMAQVHKVAPTNSTVLILGETGTGKELIAKAIHSLSQRKKRIMVKVNCASLPSALVESELFGRERGAYTGALTSQIGRFELANGSTIFLDEIGELSLELQAKLLRVLQEGEFERLGSPKTIRVDVRVIAASNRNLHKEVEEGRFREDLYYRLKVFPIEMPPLRKRTEDIPALVSAFIREFSEKMGKNIHRLSRGTIEAMQKYPWPGNVRELRNVIEQAFIISEGEVLRVHLPAGPTSALSEILPLEKMEYEHILQALEKCQGRIKGTRGAAQMLGLKPSTLYSKMEKLGIPTLRSKDGITS